MKAFVTSCIILLSILLIGSAIQERGKESTPLCILLFLLALVIIAKIWT